jgi:hypothetical protein
LLNRIPDYSPLTRLSPPNYLRCLVRSSCGQPFGPVPGENSPSHWQSGLVSPRYGLLGSCT